MTHNIAHRVDDLVAGFGEYLDVFKRENPFTKNQLHNHSKTTELRRQSGSVREAIGNDAFLKSLFLTLESWGMNSRAAKLIKPEEFVNALNRRVQDLVDLEGKRLDTLGAEGGALADRLWTLIENLGITETRSRVVAGTKALHHILPDLVPPMDRAYTAAFFGWSPQRLQGREERFFVLAFPVYANIAERVRPERNVTDGWNSSITKVVDNAVVGYCKQHRLDTASYQKALASRAKKLGIYDQIIADAKTPAYPRRRPRLIEPLPFEGATS